MTIGRVSMLYQLPALMKCDHAQALKHLGVGLQSADVIFRRPQTQVLVFKDFVPDAQLIGVGAYGGASSSQWFKN